MMDLSNLDELKQACLDVVEHFSAETGYIAWGDQLREFLTEVRAANLQTRASQEFHEWIWNSNPVSSLQWGDIAVDAAIVDAEFRNWLAERSMEQLPDTRESRDKTLNDFIDQLENRMRQYTSPTPRAKIYRVMAGFFPTEFTTVCDVTKLKQLHKAMFGHATGSGPSCHANILEKIEEVIGLMPADDDIDAIVDRMRLPWLLYEHHVKPQVQEKNVVPIEQSSKGLLIPLPAASQTRGMTGISGGRETLLKILEFCRKGTTSKDLRSYIKSFKPDLKEVTLNSMIHVIAREYDCLNRDGDRVKLTDRGQAFLDLDDPGLLMDWLITTILGVDHVLTILRDEDRCSRKELASRIKRVNPHWTTDRIPRVIISELREFGMLVRDDSGVLSLTNAGKEWALRIHWEPESLAPQPQRTEDDLEEQFDSETVPVSLPSFVQIRDAISKCGHFEEQVIRKLHYGLWANERRHFAVLTGLSGTGKTLLARAYGNAIAKTSNIGDSNILTVPVQPGWYDPSSLLGYVNPLQGDSYIGTPFLDFLIKASESPEQPVTVVLDEMNLSHPEQYLAPILSAMETGEALTLHSEDSLFEGLPSKVLYPNNMAIIGTVNMDETTHGISDKVLDRAFTIEFWDVELDEYPRWEDREHSDKYEDSVRLLLNDLMQSLRPARLHFGWRIVDDVLDYMDRVIADNDNVDVLTALDDVVYAKILPKLRGDDSPRFREALKKTREVLDEHGLKNCVRKVEELIGDLESTGSARFWR